MKKEFQLTKDGVAELEAELKEQIGKRTEIAEKLKIARSYGDLSENAEYHNARDEQVSLEGRIAEIEHILKNVEVIKKAPTGSVSLGNKVTLKAGGKEVAYTVVGSVEADPSENKISNESPLGTAMIGKKVGDEVAMGKNTFTIAAIA